MNFQQKSKLPEEFDWVFEEVGERIDAGATISSRFQNARLTSSAVGALRWDSRDDVSIGLALEAHDAYGSKGTSSKYVGNSLKWKESITIFLSRGNNSTQKIHCAVQHNQQCSGKLIRTVLEKFLRP
jgi:hypothetical protein